MKFDVCICNLPYNRHKLHYSILKRIKYLYCKIVFIIPSKDGNIESSKFNCDCYTKYKIYFVRENEKIKILGFTKKIKSGYFIHVPSISLNLKFFYEYGTYKDKHNSFYTFSFKNKNDLELFKNRLYKKDWDGIRNHKISTPNYYNILKDIDYIKHYREI
jgi:hypothetical protein